MSKPHRRRSPNRRPIPPAAPLHPRPQTYKQVIGPDDSVRSVPFQPGRLDVDLRDTMERARNGAPEFAVVFLAAAYTVGSMRGHKANVCAQACVHLADALSLLGIEAVITPAMVTVHEHGGLQSVYGTATPTWTGNSFDGHCFLYLPSERRLVDPTIRQFDRFKHLPYPYVGQVAYARRSADVLAPDMSLLVYVKERRVEYQVVEGGAELILDAEATRAAIAANPDLPQTIAAQAVDAIRTLDIADRLPPRHDRIRALIAAVGDAELQYENGVARFLIEGTPTSIRGLLE